VTDVREDQTQIGEVLVRYATGIDRRDWLRFRSCWTEDAEADYGAVGRFSGVGAICDYMARTHEPLGDTLHRLSNIAIEVDGDTATGRTYIHAVLMVRKDDPTKWVDFLGYYDDDFVRTPDGWRIRRRTFHQSRMLRSQRQTEPPQPRG